MFAYAYDVQSIAIAFGITAVYFGALTVIGYTTKINLMKFGPLLYVSLLVQKEWKTLLPKRHHK